jgi:hypothetical protein
MNMNVRYLLGILLTVLIIAFVFYSQHIKSLNSREDRVTGRWSLINEVDKFTNRRSCTVIDNKYPGAFLTRQKNGSATYFFPPSQLFRGNMSIALEKMQETCFHYERDVYAHGNPNVCLEGSGRNYHYIMKYLVNGGSEIFEQSINTLEGLSENDRTILYININSDHEKGDLIQYEYRVYMSGFYILDQYTLDQKDKTRGPEYEIDRGAVLLTELHAAYAISQPCVAVALW